MGYVRVIFRDYKEVILGFCWGYIGNIYIYIYVCVCVPTESSGPQGPLVYL